MSLVCDETEKSIKSDQPLFAGTRGGIYSALCADVVNHIPDRERRSERCKWGEEGVDIHEATAGRDLTSSYYTIAGFTLGKILFSISNKTAKKILPRHIKTY